MTYLTSEKAKIIYGSIDEEQVSSTAGFVVTELDDYAIKFEQCSCAECAESAQWARATAICLTEGRRFQSIDSPYALTVLGTHRALLHLASQGALNELLHRLREAEKHNAMTMPYQPKI